MRKDKERLNPDTAYRGSGRVVWVIAENRQLGKSLLRIRFRGVLRGPRGEREEDDQHQRGKPDADPREPGVALGYPALLSVADIADAIAIGVALFEVGLVRAVVFRVDEAVLVEVGRCQAA